MANNTNKKEAMGFNFTSTSAQAVTGRTIPGSQELISTCNALALDAIKKAGSDPEIGKLAAAVQSGDHEALVAFVDKAVEVPDKSMLDGATEDELSRLLESRRSDRSKAKKAGLTTLDTIRRYISAWIAELVIRAASGKAYKAPSTGFSVEDMDGADRDAITKKIKSLQSKRCRLSQAYRAIVAAGVTDTVLKDQLDQIDADIKALNDMRGVQPKAVKTSNTVPTNDQLAAYLKSLSPEEVQAMLDRAAQ